MNHLFINPYTLITVVLGSTLLANCSLKPASIEENTKKSHSLTINTIDYSALQYRARYGANYEINGNVIAKYPHFNLSLFSKKTLPSLKGSIHVYELSSQDGFGKTHITCDSRHTEKKHLYLEGLHFYYHSNTEGSINIYMPPQLLANR